MCGITMIFHCDDKVVTPSQIQRMNTALNHRGPDGQGDYLDKNMGLGHTRLSIVDIEHGAQPMLSSEGRHVISFNGEIYNYWQLGQDLRQQGVRFKTHCDTEVLNELYAREGVKALDKLRGMFAFAVYDRQDRSLFVARDRLGIKPFYYFFDGKTLVGASEIKALFASGLVEPKLNVGSIRQHFNYQFSISPYTMFEGIYELPPGHYLTLSPAGELQITEYWDLHFPEEGEYESHDFDYWKKAFEDALHDAAKTHLIGDVPIGAYLSGGLDSSTTTLLLKEHYPQPLRTFSIHFTNPNSDESYAYRPVAEHLGVANTELTMEDEREGGYFELLKSCLYHLEQPQRMAVDIPHFLLSEFVRQRNYKVVYTGDGADEILAGYDCFRQDNVRLWGNEQESEEARLAFYLADFSEVFAEQQLEMLAELHEPTNQSKTIQRFGCYPVWFDFWQILNEPANEIFRDSAKNQGQEQMDQLISRIKPKIRNRHRINQSLYLATKTRLPDWILWKSDPLSMAHSVEARVPFMDHPLVELAARIPPEFKLKDMDEKYILKQIVSPKLPNIPGNYKKRGFYTPIKEWFFQKQHQEQLDHYFSRDKLDETGIFQPDSVKHMTRELLATPIPENIDDYYRVMKLEWSLMLVLTTQMLHTLFIAKEAPCFHDI